jgi:hypothetical protein
MVKQPVFLDSSALNDLRNLVSEGVHRSDAIVLLATKGVLTRPWCLIELLEATRKKIPIMVVEIAGRGFDRQEARAFVTKLEVEMAGPGLDLLHTLIGPDLAELQEACLQMLDVEEDFLVLNPHAGDGELVAMMKDTVERLGQRTGREIKWDQGAGSLKLKGPMTPGSSAACRMSVGQNRLRRTNRGTDAGSFKLEQSGLVAGLRKVTLEKTASVKRRLTRLKSSLKDPVTNSASEVFVCCSRADALNHARVLRSELSVRLNRGCAIGGGASTAEWIDQSEAVVVVLTKALVTDPDALFEIWTALSLEVPIITVAISGKFDFDRAAEKLANLPLAMTRVGEGGDGGSKNSQRSKRSETSKTEQQLATRLKGRLPSDADVVLVGRVIHER